MEIDNIDDFIKSTLRLKYNTYIDINNIRFTKILDKSYLYYTDIEILENKFNFSSRNKYRYSCSWIMSLKGVPYISVGRGDYPLVPLDNVIKWIEELFAVRINSYLNNDTNFWNCNIELKYSKLILMEKTGFKYKEGSLIYCIKLLLDY